MFSHSLTPFTVSCCHPRFPITNVGDRLFVIEDPDPGDRMSEAYPTKGCIPTSTASARGVGKYVGQILGDGDLSLRFPVGYGACLSPFGETATHRRGL